jgi:methenyltetrahydromethanopterin cyclohydrolase
MDLSHLQSASANELTRKLFAELSADSKRLHCEIHTIADATILDAGVRAVGSIAAGLRLARLCLGDLAEVQIIPTDYATYASAVAVMVQSDDPTVSCLGCQYAGWPVQTDDFFAMGSGPMRMARGKEAMLVDLDLVQPASAVVGVLESDTLPTESAVHDIADQCNVDPSDLFLAIASSTSMAGNVQVVSRSVETALHKMHELNFDVRCVKSCVGHAPLSPPAKPGDTAGGIGRTNDAILYGATVTMWVDADDDDVQSVVSEIPSETSSDYGRPFADVFQQYDCDFYKVDPMLFSPAVVVLHNLRTGRSWTAGRINSEVLFQSFA